MYVYTHTILSSERKRYSFNMGKKRRFFFSFSPSDLIVINNYG